MRAFSGLGLPPQGRRGVLGWRPAEFSTNGDPLGIRRAPISGDAQL